MHCCVTTLGKLITPVYLCHQVVSFGTDQGAVMLFGWEGKLRAWWKVMAAYQRVYD